MALIEQLIRVFSQILRLLQLRVFTRKRPVPHSRLLVDGRSGDWVRLCGLLVAVASDCGRLPTTRYMVSARCPYYNVKIYCGFGLGPFASYVTKICILSYAPRT